MKKVVNRSRTLPSKLKPIYIGVLSLTLYANPHYVLAADTTWDGSTDNNWFDGTNWDTGNAPTNADKAVLNNGVINILSAGAVSEDASLNNASSAITVSGAGSSWVNSGLLNINAGGSITINSGATVSNTTSSIHGAGSVSVSGSGSVWTNNGALRVNNGSVTISDGAQVNVTSLGVVLTSFSPATTGTLHIGAGAAAGGR